MVSVSSVLTNCMHCYSKCLSQSIIRSRGIRIVLVNTHFFRSNPIVMVRLQVANIRANLEPLSCQVQVLPKEMRMLGESKILSFFVSGVD